MAVPADCFQPDASSRHASEDAASIALQSVRTSSDISPARFALARRFLKLDLNLAGSPLKYSSQVVFSVTYGESLLFHMPTEQRFAAASCGISARVRESCSIWLSSNTSQRSRPS